MHPSRQLADGLKSWAQQPDAAICMHNLIAAPCATMLASRLPQLDLPPDVQHPRDPVQCTPVSPTAPHRCLQQLDLPPDVHLLNILATQCLHRLQDAAPEHYASTLASFAKVRAAAWRA